MNPQEPEKPVTIESLQAELAELKAAAVAYLNANAEYAMKSYTSCGDDLDEARALACETEISLQWLCR